MGGRECKARDWIRITNDEGNKHATGRVTRPSAIARRLRARRFRSAGAHATLSRPGSYARTGVARARTSPYAANPMARRRNIARARAHSQRELRLARSVYCQLRVYFALSRE